MSASSSSSSSSHRHRKSFEAEDVDLATHSIKTIWLHVPERKLSTEVLLDGKATVGDLQRVAAELLGGGRKPRLQGLPCTAPSLLLGELKLKAPHVVTVVPSPGTGSGDEREDMVCRVRDEEAVSVLDTAQLRERIQLRVQKYAGAIVLHPLSPNKRNLVLDLDATLIDTELYNQRCVTPRQCMRPYLHELLRAVAPAYNLLIWSATGNEHIVSKLRDIGALGGDERTGYHISVLVDYGAMVRVKRPVVSQHSTSTTSSSSGSVAGATHWREHNSKPLAVLFGLFPQLTPDNTLMVDDHHRCVVLNESSGLLVAPYKASECNTDREFRLLATYLLRIAHLPSLRTVDHSRWREVAAAADDSALQSALRQASPAHSRMLHRAKASVSPAAAADAAAAPYTADALHPHQPPHQPAQLPQQQQEEADYCGIFGIRSAGAPPAAANASFSSSSSSSSTAACVSQEACAAMQATEQEQEQEQEQLVMDDVSLSPPPSSSGRRRRGYRSDKQAQRAVAAAADADADADAAACGSRSHGMEVQEDGHGRRGRGRGRGRDSSASGSTGADGRMKRYATDADSAARTQTAMAVQMVERTVSGPPQRFFPEPLPHARGLGTRGGAGGGHDMETDVGQPRQSPGRGAWSRLRSLLQPNR